MEMVTPMGADGRISDRTSCGLVCGTEAEEINCRTGCVGCNLASRDTALETLLTAEGGRWEYLTPLMRLRPLYAELKRPHNRLRKTGRELTKDGKLVANPNRMGPLTMEARK